MLDAESKLTSNPKTLFSACSLKSVEVAFHMRHSNLVFHNRRQLKAYSMSTYIVHKSKYCTASQKNNLRTWCNFLSEFVFSNVEGTSTRYFPAGKMTEDACSYEQCCAVSNCSGIKTGHFSTGKYTQLACVKFTVVAYAWICFEEKTQHLNQTKTKLFGTKIFCIWGTQLFWKNIHVYFWMLTASNSVHSLTQATNPPPRLCTCPALAQEYRKKNNF